MTNLTVANGTPLVRLRRLVLVALAVALLLPSMTGRAGVQVVDAATVAHLLALHLHGLPGEADYVSQYGAPAPFVHAHCHDSPAHVEPGPGPDEVAAAASLAGAMISTTWTTAPTLHSSCWGQGAPAFGNPPSRALPPPAEPPR